MSVSIPYLEKAKKIKDMMPMNSDGKQIKKAEKPMGPTNVEKMLKQKQEELTEMKNMNTERDHPLSKTNTTKRKQKYADQDICTMCDEKIADEDPGYEDEEGPMCTACAKEKYPKIRGN